MLGSIAGVIAEILRRLSRLEGMLSLRALPVVQEPSRVFVVIGSALATSNKSIGYAGLKGSKRSTATLTALAAEYAPYATTPPAITDDGIAYGVDIYTGAYVVVAFARIAVGDTVYCSGRLKDRDTPNDCEVECLADPVSVPGPGSSQVLVYEAVRW